MSNVMNEGLFRWRAKQMNSLHPEWRYFGDFKTLLAENGFVVTRGTERPLTYDKIEGYAFVVLAVPRWAFTDNEVYIILKYLESGGDILFLGDANIPSHINNLTDKFSIHLDDKPVEAKEYLWDDKSFLVTDFDQSHPVTEWIDELTANSIATMTYRLEA